MGRLPPWLARLREYNFDLYEELFSSIGLEVDDIWRSEDGILNGRPAFDLSNRSYRAAAKLTTFDFFADLEDDEQDEKSIEQPEYEGLESIRTWHWMHAFKMAVRKHKRIRRSLYDFLRIRLRELLDTPWHIDQPNSPTIGQIFASQRTGAMLALWHLKHPTDVVDKGQASGTLKEIVQQGFDEVTWNNLDGWKWTPGNRWASTPGNERSLVKEILKAVKEKRPSLYPMMLSILHWPDWDPKASDDPRRGAFPESLVEATRFLHDGDEGEVIGSLKDRTVPEVLHTAMRNIDWPLPPKEDLKVTPIGDANDHWLVAEKKISEGLRLRLRKDGNDILVYGGLSPKPLDWLNRQGLSPAPDETRKVPLYIVALGPTKRKTGIENEIRAGLVFQSAQPNDLLVGVTLARSGEPTDAIELPLRSPSDAVNFALQEPNGDKWNVRRNRDTEIPVALSRVDPDSPLPSLPSETALKLDVSAWQPDDVVMVASLSLQLNDLQWGKAEDEDIIAGDIQLKVTIKCNFLSGELPISFHCSGNNTTCFDGDSNCLKQFIWEADKGATFKDVKVGELFNRLLPIKGLAKNLTPSLLIDRAGFKWESDVGESPFIPLADGAVRLVFGGGFNMTLSSTQGLNLNTTDKELFPELYLNFFTASKIWQADIEQAWSKVSDQDFPIFSELIKLSSNAIDLGEGISFLNWDGEIPTVNPKLFMNLKEVEVNPALPA